MGASQHASGDVEPSPRRQRRAEPGPAEIAEQIALYRAMAPDEFAKAIAVFVAAGAQQAASRGEDYERHAYAIRSPELARRALRVLPQLAREPDRWTSAPADESRAAYLKRIGVFRSRADKEEQFLHLVLAGEAARRGAFLPDPNPRGRARRRLADEQPVRFVELLAEERQVDRDKAAADARERRKAKRSGRASGNR
ncbi:MULTISPECIES: hypothetical protein [unclassified Streptomyces]|uniref:hypothetical protein n=1 Tax=unclassified Streptomyces TaxID=2593676 RepID=UPI00332A8620